MEEPHVTEAVRAEPDSRPPAPWLTILSALLAIGWIAFVVVAALNGYRATTPTLADVGGLIATAAAPLAFLAAFHLLVSSLGRRHARRFAADAGGIVRQADLIDARMRDLHAQAAALRAETQAVADRLDASLTAARQGFDGIQAGTRNVDGTASALAERLAALLARLVDADTRLRGATAVVEETMLSALDGTEGLEARIDAVGKRAQAAETSAGDSAARLVERIRAIDAAARDAAGRIEASGTAMAETADAAVAHTLDADVQARRSLEERAAQMNALADGARAVIAEAAEGSTAALAERVAAIGAEVSAIGASLAAQDKAGAALIDRVRAGLDEVEARLGSLDQRAAPTAERLANAMDSLADRADRVAGALANGGSLAETLMVRAEALLAALDANARELDETLPAALDRVNRAAEEAGGRIGALAPGMAALGDGGERLGALLERTAVLLADQHARTSELTSLAGEADAATRGMIDGSGAQLVEMMVRVRDSAAAAAARTRETIERIVPDLARALGEAGEAALRPLLDDRVEARLAALSDSSVRAVAAAEGAAGALGERLSAINSAAAALDARFEDVGGDGGAGARAAFAGRVSLLLDGLNRASIDLVALLHGETAESDWNAFLAGNRGVFAHRAVALMEEDAANLARLYGMDGDFRDTARRFIADFEAMLRAVLASREGQAMGVVLLSSDIGKLYAALARASDR